MKQWYFYLIALVTVVTIAFICHKGYQYYGMPEYRCPYQTLMHADDTIRIAYIGDSWAFGHKYHYCHIAEMIEKKWKKPVKVSSYGIGGLTSKEIYHALFELKDFQKFMQKGYDYCYISAGINDCYKKIGASYYKYSMDAIIQFLLANNIRPIIQEIPDYDILKAYDRQTTSKKWTRRLSMLVTGSSLDCKQDYRDALNELLTQKNYTEDIIIIRYQSWNSNYEKDLKQFYIEDGMHLNDYGYQALDSAIVCELNKYEHSHEKNLLSR